MPRPGEISCRRRTEDTEETWGNKQTEFLMPQSAEGKARKRGAAVAEAAFQTTGRLLHREGTEGWESGGGSRGNGPREKRINVELKV